MLALWFAIFIYNVDSVDYVQPFYNPKGLDWICVGIASGFIFVYTLTCSIILTSYWLMRRRKKLPELQYMFNMPQGSSTDSQLNIHAQPESQDRDDSRINDNVEIERTGTGSNATESHLNNSPYPDQETTAQFDHPDLLTADSRQDGFEHFTKLESTYTKAHQTPNQSQGATSVCSSHSLSNM